jgi:hypothetical protein
MSLMWMPPHTTRPPFLMVRKAAGTRLPAGAKMMAASSGSGGASSEAPAQAAPSARAKAWVTVQIVARLVIAGDGNSSPT